MSGSVIGKNKSNRRGRPKKSILHSIQQKSSHVQNQVAQSSYNSNITKPLTIIRVAKKVKQEQVPQESLLGRDRLSSDDTATYAESVEGVAPTHMTTNDSDILTYTSLNKTTTLSFESSDLSSEDDIFENSTSPSPLPVNHNSGVSHSQGVDLSRLPKVSFQTINGDNTKANDSDDESVYKEQQQIQEEQLLIQHYQTLQQQHYAQGVSSTVFNNKEIIRQSRIFNRPENHYIHYIEPSEVDLYDAVEYDMDEQDKNWLQMYNKERRAEFLGDISPYLFECIMDKLEKEWFKMLKNAPKTEEKDETMFPEDSACAVCDDTEVENSNAIVFCDGCNVAVHQDCYGIPYIPEGQWLCRKCMLSPESPVSCIFCPNEGGAFKQTNTNQWAHLLCAIWIPEVGVSNSVYMEPIDMIENIPKSRWKLGCSICRKKQGACIQCDNKHCFSAFHVTCAKAAGLCMRMRPNSSQSEGVVLNAYCDKHTPRDYQKPRSAVTKRGRHRGRPPRQESNSKSQQQFDAADNKVARAHQLQYSTGVPIASDIMLASIDNLPAVRFSSIRKRQQLVDAIAHYWSLKRESRRGAPLLRRLHLEPWTANSSRRGNENELFIQKSIVSQLRTDLEKVRILSEQVQKRERQKLERIKKQKDYLEMALFPLEYTVRPVLDQFMEVDRKKLFHTISNEAKISFAEIQQKLSLHQYLTVEQFENDIETIWEECLTRNAADASRCKVANKLKKASKKLFALIEAKMERFELMPDNTWGVAIDNSIFDYKREEDEAMIAEEPTENADRVQKRLERERMKEEKEKERQRIIQARIEGRAKAKAMRFENKDQNSLPKLQNGYVNNTNHQSPKLEKATSSSLLNCYEPYVETLDKQVNDLQIQNSLFDNTYPTEILDEPLIISTNNENELTINNFDQFFQAHGSIPFIKPDITQEQEYPIMPSQITNEYSLEKDPPVKESTEKTSKKRQRSNSSSSARRLTRSAGLKASIEELTKRPKISHEARMLYSSYNGVSHLDRPVEVYKENRKRHAPLGWVYLDDEEEEGNVNDDDEEDNQQADKRRRQSRNGIPIPDFRRGEIVWARVDRYPSHPAKFLNYSDEEAGPKLIASRRYAGDVLVEFLKVPEMHRYGWVGRRTIAEMGDPAIDKARLAEALQKRAKRSAFIEEAKEGYRCAGDILGLDPEPIIDAVFNSSIPKKKRKHSHNKT